MPGKTYIGDSVYAEFENGMIKLTTNNGVGDSNTILLEQEVFNALINFANAVFEELSSNG